MCSPRAGFRNVNHGYVAFLFLQECIRALGRRGAHLPFRASKLTQVRLYLYAMIGPNKVEEELLTVL